MRYGNWLRFVFFLVSLPRVLYCGQEIVVKNNLQGLFHDLVGGQYTHALICSSCSTRFDVLKASSKRNTQIAIVMQENDFYQRCIRGRDREYIVGYFADVHDKIAVLRSSQGALAGYVGSANFTERHFDNTELVLRISDAEAVPGFVQHVKNLLQRSRLYPGLKKSKDQISLPSAGVPLSRRRRRGSCTRDELVSYFDFEQEGNYDLVSWMADRIKEDAGRHYLISTMSLSHPVFINRIRNAVLKGSSFEILVDKDNMKGVGRRHVFFSLVQLSQTYPNLQVRWRGGLANGRKSIHHAKILVRYPNERDEEGVSIVSTANFTETGGRQSNCALVLVHNSPHQYAIRSLKDRFYSWWSRAETVSGGASYADRPYCRNFGDDRYRQSTSYDKYHKDQLRRSCRGNNVRRGLRSDEYWDLQRDRDWGQAYRRDFGPTRDFT